MVEVGPPEPEPAAPVGPRRFKVLIDVGHGGYDFGAPGFFGILEKDLCLRIARKTKSRLERAAKLADFPMDVELSRGDDHFIPLRERARRANEWIADLFISIHANSSPVARARGFEVYFLSHEASDADASRIAKQENGDAKENLSNGVLSILSDLKTNTHILESSRFAESVYASLASILRPNGKGVRQAPFTVLSGTQMPALLIEVGYLTNPEEADALSKTSYQHRIAGGVAEGVLNFALQMRRLSRGYSRPGKRTT
jgi:N-acetylmuramoyl-L-alanine amidase